MFCPAGANAGLIQLVGPISPSDLSTIRINRSPLSVNIGPRTTPPSMVGNRIEESGTCTYSMNKYNLIDIQICAPVHTGYNLPGHNDTPQAELIISYSANSTPSSVTDVAGILMCMPIYVSSEPSHHSYLYELIHQDSTMVTTATLDTLLTSQSSFGYRTCFETQDSTSRIGSHSLFVNVYPNGIHLAPDMYQQLYLILQQQLYTYQLPPGIRGGDATVRSYTVDDNGVKSATQVDTNGVLYTTPLSTCTDEFKNRFEYFAQPPRIPTISSKQSIPSQKDQCPTVKQYKCLPFDQLRDQTGTFVKMSDGTSLADILPSDTATSNSSGTSSPSSGMSVADIEELVGGIAAVIVLVAAGMWIANRVSNSNE